MTLNRICRERSTDAQPFVILPDASVCVARVRFCRSDARSPGRDLARQSVGQRRGRCAARATAGSQGRRSQSADGTHTLNLKDADIQVLIATVSEITGKNFIIGPNVQGKVTVVSATPMKPDEIYDVFLSVLRVHGYAAIRPAA